MKEENKFSIGHMTAKKPDNYLKSTENLIDRCETFVLLIHNWGENEHSCPELCQHSTTDLLDKYNDFSTANTLV